MMYFDEIRNKLFITFNYQITTMSMKAENRDRVFTHDKPVTAVIYNPTYNQVSDKKNILLTSTYENRVLHKI